MVQFGLSSVEVIEWLKEKRKAKTTWFGSMAYAYNKEPSTAISLLYGFFVHYNESNMWIK